MNIKKWESIYKKIEKDFDFLYVNEKKVVKFFDILLQKKNIISNDELKNLINSKEVFIFGAGPSLVYKIKKNKIIFENKLKIAADGATSALMKFNIIPEIIVTDLDGCIKDQIDANNNGTIVIIHSHADNLNKIKNNIDKFQGRIMGTTQINLKSLKLIQNFGGFTDGDRSVFIADNFNAKEINLVGFDFNNKIGKYSFSKNKNLDIKFKKLKWCKYLIELLMKNNHNIKYY